jgi:hypothetical protein
MRLFLRSRALLACVLFATALEASLPLWGARAFKITYPGFFEAVPLGVPAQFAAVAAILYSTDSAFHPLERMAARPLFPMRLLSLLIVTTPPLGVLVLACAVMGDSGTIGWAAPVRAFLGMLGLGLVAAQFIDRRLAGLSAVLAIAAPMTLNPIQVTGFEVWGFAYSGSPEPTSWLVATALFVLGSILHVTFLPRGPQLAS